jgi:cytochrome bd-type quinol oxidase subunit 1
MKKLILTFISAFFIALNAFVQTPQNVDLGDDENKSLWDSTSAIIFAAVIILLLIVGRTWSKKVHQKRDEMSRKDKEE